jgi:hypothetical protein
LDRAPAAGEFCNFAGEAQIRRFLERRPRKRALFSWNPALRGLTEKVVFVTGNRVSRTCYKNPKLPQPANREPTSRETDLPIRAPLARLGQDQSPSFRASNRCKMKPPTGEKRLTSSKGTPNRDEK